MFTLYCFGILDKATHKAMSVKISCRNTQVSGCHRRRIKLYRASAVFMTIAVIALVACSPDFTYAFDGKQKLSKSSCHQAKCVLT